MGHTSQLDRIQSVVLIEIDPEDKCTSPYLLSVVLYNPIKKDINRKRCDIPCFQIYYRITKRMSTKNIGVADCKCKFA